MDPTKTSPNPKRRKEDPPAPHHYNTIPGSTREYSADWYDDEMFPDTLQPQSGTGHDTAPTDSGGVRNDEDYREDRADFEAEYRRDDVWNHLEVQDDPGDTGRYEQEEETYVTEVEQATNNLTIWTCNIGGYYRIMSEDGTPSPHLIACLDRLAHPFVAFVNHIDLGPSDARWTTFVRSVQTIRDVRVARYRGRRHGVAILHSNSITNISYPTQELGPEEKKAPLGDATWEEDFVEIQMRQTNSAESRSRLIIIGAYFPFSKANARGALRAMETARARAVPGVNRVILIGDLNMGRFNKAIYTKWMTLTGLKRKDTPITGIKGGKAQAIWTSTPEAVENVQVWTDVTEISDHHHPLACTVPWKVNTKCIRPARIRDMMRVIVDKAKYQVEINEVGRSDDVESRLTAVMRANTALPPTPRPYYTYKKPKIQLSDPPNKAEQRQRVAKVRAAMERKLANYEKKMWAQAYKNGPMIKAAIMDRARSTCEFHPRLNLEFTTALQELSWRVSKCDVEAYYTGFVEILGNVSRDIIYQLEKDYTATELHENLATFPKDKTNTDFESRVIHLMGMPALDSLAHGYNLRKRTPKALVRHILGIYNGKECNETDFRKIVYRITRPLGMANAVDAFHCHCQNVRLTPLINAIAPKGMIGFIQHREGHDMILRILFSVEWANRTKQPFWCVQGDIEKHFDRIQHEGIAALDELLNLSEPFFGNIVQEIRNTTLKVHIDRGRPGETKQNSGCCQGDQRVPAISALILAPLVHAIERDAKGSIPPEARARMLHLIRFILNFVDDFVFGSENLKDAFDRFLKAQRMCTLLGMNLVLVRVCGTDATRVLGPHKLTHNGTSIKFEDSMKILGACIHFKTQAQCVVRKCKNCPAKTTTRICEECQDTMLDRACAMPLPSLDKIAAANSRILSSMRYGVYTCETQQTAWRKMGIKLRRRLQGVGLGGYKAAAALPAKLGGMGVENTGQALAQETMGILERAMNRSSELRELAAKLNSTGHPWPRPLEAALRAQEDSQSQDFVVTPHRSLTSDPTDQRSQDHPVQLEVTKLEGDDDRADVTVVVRSVAGPTSIRVEFELRRPLEKKWNRRAVLAAQMRILARIIEDEHHRARRVVLKNMPEAFQSTILAHEADPGRIYRRDRVYTSVLARTDVVCLTDDDTPCRAMAVERETSHEIPDAYPITVRIKGENIVTGPSGPPVEKALEKQMIQAYRSCRQILSIIPREEDIDHEASAPAAGTQRGIHFDTRLRTPEAEQILRMTTGALVRTPVTEEKYEWEGVPCTVQQDPIVKRIVGSPCKHWVGGPQIVCTRGAMMHNEIPQMLGRCGATLSLEHILSHIPEDDFTAVMYKMNKDSKVGPIMKLLDPHPRYMALGFVPRDLYKQQPPEKQKALRKQLHATSTAYARIGLEWYKKCTGDDLPTVKDLVVEKGEDVMKKYKYIALADAAVPQPKEGEEPAGEIVVGLGGYIAESKDPSKVIVQFRVRRVIPMRSSGLAEHLGNLVLHKIAVTSGLDDVCIGCDNIGIPNQHEGEFRVGNACVRVVRAKTATLKVRLKRYKDAWFPREENSMADSMAKLALTSESYKPEWIEELDDVLGEMETIAAELLRAEAGYPREQH